MLIDPLDLVQDSDQHRRIALERARLQLEVERIDVSHLQAELDKRWAETEDAKSQTAVKKVRRWAVVSLFVVFVSVCALALVKGVELPFERRLGNFLDRVGLEAPRPPNDADSPEAQTTPAATGNGGEKRERSP